MMQRRGCLVHLGRQGLWCLATLAGAGPAARAATAARRVARIGWLGWSDDTAPNRELPVTALRAGLAELGWREGVNLVIERRQGDREQAPDLATDLLAAGVELVVAQGPMALFARARLGRMPLVFTINGDPVEAGLVASLARPGGTATGLTALGEELAAKRVELLKQARPGLRQVAALANDVHPGRGIELAATRSAAQQLGLALRYLPVRKPEDFDAAFATLAADGVQGIVAFPDTLINRQAGAIAEYARRQRVPTISGWSEFAQAGNLLAYGPSREAFFRRTAYYAHKLLDGTPAAELPVERPTRLSLVVHRGAAAAMGLALPRELLLRADEVIE